MRALKAAAVFVGIVCVPVGWFLGGVLLTKAVSGQDSVSSEQVLILNVTTGVVAVLLARRVARAAQLPPWSGLLIVVPFINFAWVGLASWRLADENQETRPLARP